MAELERSFQLYARREERLRTIDENRLNTLRDQFDRAEFENALNQSIIQQNMLSQRNQAYNQAYQKATSNQSKNRPTSDSDLSKQLDHLEAMGFYARPTRFSFYIEALAPATNDRLIRNCISTSLPGRALMTQGFKIYGNPLEQVYEVNYATEMNMTFRVGEDMLERDLFESWMNTSISYNTADVAYPDEYMTTMRIYQLDRKDGYLYCIRLNNVFCKAIADMDFSSDSSDQVQTIQVTIAYSDFAVIGRTNTDPENLNNDEDPTPSAFEDPPKSRATLNRSSANDQAREDQNLQQLRIRNAHYQNIRTIRVTPFTKFRY